MRPRILVSLTAISGRIGELHRTLDSILRQTVEPDEIHLFVSTRSYLLDKGIAKADIPAPVTALARAGRVKIRYTPNTGPHRKLLPILRENFGRKGIVIITADDDTIYPPTWVENLVERHLVDPAVVLGYRCRYIKADRRKIKPYRQWPRIGYGGPTNSPVGLDPMLIFPTGQGGVLYEPSSFSKHVFDDSYLKTCPFSADIWFKFMALANGVGAMALSPENGRDFPSGSASPIKLSHLNELNPGSPKGKDSQLRTTHRYFRSQGSLLGDPWRNMAPLSLLDLLYLRWKGPRPSRRSAGKLL